MEQPADSDLPDDEPGSPRFNSLDEVIHEVYATEGAEVLREALSMLEVGREDLEDGAAVALEAAGKPSIAAVVREVAVTKPSGVDLNNPYEEGSLDWHVRRQIWFRRRRMATSTSRQKSPAT
jgi:hypothetical protein